MLKKVDYKSIKSIAIGGFDGMHIGHQALFNELCYNGAVVVINTGFAKLTPMYERQRHTKYPLVFLELDEIRGLDDKGFVKLLKEMFENLQKIVVGYDFHFGKDRKFSFKDLKKLFDAEVVVVDEVKYNNDSIHSHKIRNKLEIGDIAGANHFLGYNYTICGKQILGQGLGKKELVATINIDAREFFMPKEGVYVTLTQIDDEEHFHPSVSFVGHRITTDGSFAVESHILDGVVDCKNRARISFVEFLRENQKFDSLGELKNMIDKDISRTNLILKRLEL